MSLILSGTDGISDVDGSASTPALRGTDANTGIFFPAADTIAFAEGGVESMRIDSAGNVGIGVTPSAWSGFRALQLGTTTSLWSGLSGNTSSFYTNNAFFNGTNRIYLTNGFASEYIMGQGLHIWYTAASGTAGGTVSFSESMRIDTSGNLILGTTAVAAAEGYRFYKNYGRYDNGTFTGFIGSGTSLGSAAASDFSIRSENALAFMSGGSTERMRIDSSGNVGIGITPSAWTTFRALQMLGGSIAGISQNQFDVVQNAYYDGSNFRYINTYGATLYQQAGSTHSFRSSASGTAGNTAAMTEVMAFSLNNTVSLQGASPVAGTGITFPATQSASSDANTLDDYEEGTFTPTIGGTVSDGTATYSTQVGQYTKIGNRVFFIIRLGWSSGTGSGSMVIRGLPFTQFNGAGDIPYAASEWSDIAWSANYSPTPVGGQNTTTIYLNQSRIGGSGAADNTAFDAAGFMSITGHYRVN